MKLSYKITESFGTMDYFDIQYFIDDSNIDTYPLNILQSAICMLVNKDSNPEVLKNVFEILVRDLGNITNKETKVLETTCKVKI